MLLCVLVEELGLLLAMFATSLWYITSALLYYFVVDFLLPKTMKELQWGEDNVCYFKGPNGEIDQK